MCCVSAVSTAIVDRLGVTWDERYGELKRYKDRFGDCNVPRGWVENPQLAKWAQHQRSFARQQMLSTERIRRLNDIGFDFEPHDTAWLDKFEELQAFFSSEGHSNVPESAS